MSMLEGEPPTKTHAPFSEAATPKQCSPPRQQKAEPHIPHSDAKIHTEITQQPSFGNSSLETHNISFVKQCYNSSNAASEERSNVKDTKVSLQIARNSSDQTCLGNVSKNPPPLANAYTKQPEQTVGHADSTHDHGALTSHPPSEPPIIVKEEQHPTKLMLPVTCDEPLRTNPPYHEAATPSGQSTNTSTAATHATTTDEHSTAICYSQPPQLTYASDKPSSSVHPPPVLLLLLNGSIFLFVCILTCTEEFEEDEQVREADDVQNEDDDEDEEEVEEGQDEYEQDGFIVDDVDEEEEEEVKESSDEELKSRKRKKKKREAEENYELDEDDYELLQEANVTGFHRPKSGSKKFKRLKKAERNVDDQEQLGFSDEDEAEEGGRSGATAEEKIKRTLFGDDEGLDREDVDEDEDQLDVDDEEPLEEEEDEMADFIVEEDDVDENGQHIRRRNPKKKVPRQAHGVSSFALQEAQEIFGDVDELLILRKEGLREKLLEAEDDDDDTSNRLENEFEPSILAEKYMRPEDDKIRENDVPERIQLLERSIGGVLQAEDTVPEAKWIYEHVFGSLAVSSNPEFEHISKLDKEEVLSEIANVLGLLHDQKFEVPFIAMYRKEVCSNLIKDKEEFLRDTEYENDKDIDKPPRLKMHKALWAVQTWDKKWLLLQKRKEALRDAFERRAYDEAERDETKRMVLESVLEALSIAKSERAIDDVDAKFNLYFPPDEVEVPKGQHKRPKRRSRYNVCRKAGYGLVAKKFGLSAEQFAKNLQVMYKSNDVEDATTSPEDVAAEFCKVYSGDPQFVIKGARHMAAVEISCEPAVREYVRTVYMNGAVISTKPTADGKSAIDSFHRYKPVKELTDKPISEFNDAKWLLLQKAEEEKLIQVTIGLQTDAEEDIMREFEEKYLSDSVSSHAKLWNEQRKMILKDALGNILLPIMERELRSMLTARAKSWLVQDYGQQIWKKVSVAPYKPNRGNNNEEDNSEEEQEIRVMSCCTGAYNEPTTFVMLNASGEVVDVLLTLNLNARSKDAATAKRRDSDCERFLNFFLEHQPHVIVLGASSMHTKYLKDAIFEAIFKLVEERPRDVPEGLENVQPLYADESLARLFENSHVSKEQLPTQKGVVRRAVALGRYVQNPLAMVASLCGPRKEILSLRLHPYEDFLDPDEKYEAIEQIMVTVTNQVGLDINLAASHEWMFAPLQFVSGLGPRKASSLQRAILRAGRIYSRKEVWSNLGVITKCVFFNCAGFLRVRGTGQAASGNHVMDPLDDTRIHPESYDAAKTMAEDMYLQDVRQDIDDMEEEAQEMAIEHVQKNPALLKQLQIEQYAIDFEKKKGVKKPLTLDDIRNELIQGFREWRTPFKEPTQDEEFYLLTGESEETLPEGKIIQATVRRAQHSKVICDLVSGLTGIVLKENLSDDMNSDAIERLGEGSVITCKVKSINRPKYLVELSCKPSDLQSDEENDAHFKGLDKSEQERVQKEKEKAKKAFKSRMIVHPRFQNISEDEAIQYLSDKDVGEALLRPSPRGAAYLILTLKFFDGVYAHKEIKELDKDKKDFTSFLRLGKTLKIDDDTFEDLDELIDRYVDPLVANLKTILSYRKFKRGTRAEIDDILRKEKYENPSRIPYYLSVSYEHPGAFMLAYIRSTNPHHDYVGLYPKGFKFRKTMFDNLDKLVHYFQRHINDDIHGAPPPMKSVAAMVRRSPGPGGSGGSGSVGSGWGGSAGAGTDGAWNPNTRMEWERSSTPGSRTGGNDYNRKNPAAGIVPNSLPRPPHSSDRGFGGRSGGRNGGFSRGFGTNEGRKSGMHGKGTQDGGNHFGRSTGHQAGGSSRGSHQSNFGNKFGQSSGGSNGWASKADDWGSNNSGARTQDSPSRGWTVSSDGSGWGSQGNTGNGNDNANDGGRSNDKANDGWGDSSTAYKPTGGDSPWDI